MPLTKPLKPIPSKANLFCFRCQVKLGKILNRGTFCPVCRRKICKKCLASSNLNNSFCQANLSHQTLINYQLIKHQASFTRCDAQQPHSQSNGNQLNSGTGDTVDAHLASHTRLNNNEHNLTNKNLFLKKSNSNSSIEPPSAQEADVTGGEANRTAQDFQQSGQQTPTTDECKTVNDQQVPKKTQRKNTGLYIKRAMSSTADSLAARRYRSNLRSNTSREQQTSGDSKILNTNKQLSKSCSELTQPPPHTDDRPSDYSTRCASEQNLNQTTLTKPHHRSTGQLDENFDKSASLPKFKSLNRLISKLKRSHTIGNVDDIGKRCTLFGYQTGSGSLKNQYGPKSSTLWKRSSARTLAVGHQLYLKTLNLGKMGLFKRQASSAQNVTSISISKLKGICSFCCKKITSETLSTNHPIGYTFPHTFHQLNDQTSSEASNDVALSQVPIPPARKSNLVKSNSQKETRRPAKLPIKPERQFIVQRCVLEQSCSMGELNVKQLDQISDQDSGLQTNSLEGLDQKSNHRKNHRATTLPKSSILFGRPLDSEKRGTLKVRSHIEMNEDGTFYVQDSDWEMTSESDHWQKSDQFSSISSTELNELSCEYFRLNTSLCKDKLLKDVMVDNDDTLCNRKSRRPKDEAKSDTNGATEPCSNGKQHSNKNRKTRSNDVDDDECASEMNDKCFVEQKTQACDQTASGKHTTNNLEHSPECSSSAQRQDEAKLNGEQDAEQSNDMKLDYETTSAAAISELKRDQNQLEQQEHNKATSESFKNNDSASSKPKQSSKNIKLKFTSSRPMHRTSSVDEMNKNESEFAKSSRLLANKNIKRSFSETVLHFNDDDNDVHSADDELDEDKDESADKSPKSPTNASKPTSVSNCTSASSAAPSRVSAKVSTNELTDASSHQVSTEAASNYEDDNESNDISHETSNLSYNTSASSYCLDTYSFKKQQQSKIPDQGIDFFSSDEQSIEHNLLSKPHSSLLNEPPRTKSPVLDECVEATQTEEDTNESYDKRISEEEEYLEHDSIEDKNYDLYHQQDADHFEQADELETSEPDFQSSDFDNELINRRHAIHVTSLENLFSLETIQEQDEEDCSLVDQSSLRSNVSAPQQHRIELVDSALANNQATHDDVSNIELSNVSSQAADDANNESVAREDMEDASEKSELQNESTYSQISSTRSHTDTEELINNIYKKVCFEDDESSSQDYLKFKTFKRDASVEHELALNTKATDCDSLDGDHFNSLSECTVDENVTIEDQQIVVVKQSKVSKSQPGQMNQRRPPINQLNQRKQSEPALKPEACKRSSLVNKNLEQLDKSKKKINDMLQIGKIEPRTRVSVDLLCKDKPIGSALTKSCLNTKYKSSLGKWELSESGVHMDHLVDDGALRRTDKRESKSSHLYIEGSSGVDSGPSSDDIENHNHDAEPISSIKLIKSIRMAGQQEAQETKESKYSPATVNRSSPSPLLKSKSMYNVDQQTKRTSFDYLTTDHRLSSEEFARRRRSYEVNLNCLESDPAHKSVLSNLRRKSTNYLLNQSFNQLSNEDITRIKRELIRRSEERLARFESSMSSNSALNSVNNSMIDSIRESKRDEPGYSNHSSAAAVADSRCKQKAASDEESSDENLDDYQNKRISRKQLNDKWRDTLKRSDSLDSINSIKSMNSIGSLTNDEVSNMKAISRNRIKQQHYGEVLSEDDYQDQHHQHHQHHYSPNDHYVIKDKVTTAADYQHLLTDNLIINHCRAMVMEPAVGKQLDVGLDRHSARLSLNSKPPKDNYASNGDPHRDELMSNREEDNDYDVVVENSYVEMSCMSEDNRSINNHTYKMISERENPYEFKSDSLNDLQDDLQDDMQDDLQDENPYISLRDDMSLMNKTNDYENLKMIRDALEHEDYQPKYRSTGHLKPYANTLIQRGESFNQAAYRLPQVKLPLKRSKSVPGNTLSPSSRYSCNGRTTTNSKSTLTKSNKVKENSFLFDQLEFQRKHLRQLHKQHWKYRLKNADGDDEINDYTSLFTLDQENMNRPYELLVAYDYAEEKNEISLFIKECRNFGNLSDKYLKVYLLPEKSSKQRTSLQSKTIGHVNNLIERKSFSICFPIINKKFVFQCEQLEELTNSRTIFISVWKNKKSLLEKNHCLGELFLKVKRKELKDEKMSENEHEKKTEDDDQPLVNSATKFDLADSMSKLSYSWMCLDQSLYYLGELVFAIFYEANKKQLQIEVIGCVNLLTRKRDARTLNTFCKAELKRASINVRDACETNRTNDAKETESELKEESDTKGDQNDTNNNSKENEKQVRFLVDDTLESRAGSASFSLVDSQKSVIIKNSLCPKYNKLFIFNDIQPDQLDKYGLELSIWYQAALSTPYCLGGVQLIDKAMHKSSADGATPLDNCIQEELSVWKQVLDRTKFNNWINASLHLRPID